MRTSQVFSIGASLLLFAATTNAQDGSEEELRENVVHERNEMGQNVYRDGRISDRPDSTVCFLYVGYKATGAPWLRLQVRHAAFKSLGIQEIIFTKGKVSLAMKPSAELLHTGNNGVMQWEWYDAPPDENEMKAIDAIIDEPGVTLTLKGTKQTITRELTDLERAAMENMLLQAVELGQAYEGTR
jgi:hypothetical protein